MPGALYSSAWSPEFIMLQHQQRNDVPHTLGFWALASERFIPWDQKPRAYMCFGNNVLSMLNMTHRARGMNPAAEHTNKRLIAVNI